jgi:hypothetical protein
MLFVLLINLKREINNMCTGSPRVSTPPPAPTPAPPIASPSGEEIAPTLKVAEDKMTEEEKKKKVKRRGTKALQTSGLSIPTSGSGLNIS